MSIVERAADRLRNTQRDRVAVAQPAVTPVSAGERSAQVDVPGDRQGERAGSNAAPVVQIDTANLTRAGVLAPQSMADQIAREYQRIKRPLLSSLAAGQGVPTIANANRVMIASSKPGEGKTFTAFNLALSLAREKDFSVLLVDGDVVKPSITRALKVLDYQGLMNILTGEVRENADAIFETDVPGLSFMPAGQRCGEMVELLSSRRMIELADDLGSDPSRIVIFDSPPLLATSESQALALNMGQILMVVMAGATERRAVQAALSLIEGPDRPISLVLNKSRKAHGDSYASYYGVYYGDRDEAV